MKFGCCLNMVSSGPDGTGMEWIPQAAMAGCDYLELPLAEIMHMMEPEFLALKQRLGDGGIRCRACNNFFPGKLRLIGERQERERALMQHCRGPAAWGLPVWFSEAGPPGVYQTVFPMKPVTARSWAC